MVTVKGHIIEMNGVIEWLLFQRLVKKVNPIDFLNLTDAIIQLPNFLFTISFLILLFIPCPLWVKFLIPSVLFAFGQVMVNFRFGEGDLKVLFYPLILFSSGNLTLMFIVFIVSVVILKWWALIVIPVYSLTFIISLTLTTRNEKKYYLETWHKSMGSSEVFKNNAFIFAYKYLANKHQLLKDLSPTDEETNKQEWIYHYEYMETNWSQLEEHFSEKGKRLWRAYLRLEEK